MRQTSRMLLIALLLLTLLPNVMAAHAAAYTAEGELRLRSVDVRAGELLVLSGTVAASEESTLCLQVYSGTAAVTDVLHYTMCTDASAAPQPGMNYSYALNSIGFDIGLLSQGNYLLRVSAQGTSGAQCPIVSLSFRVL